MLFSNALDQATKETRQEVNLNFPVSVEGENFPKYPLLSVFSVQTPSDTSGCWPWLNCPGSPFFCCCC